MAPSPGRRGPARGVSGGDRSARSLKAFAAEAERHRSDPDELARLFRRVAVGDPAAAQLLFDQNLGMVLRLAHALAAAGGAVLSEDELVQEGSIALVDAIRRFPADGVDPAAAGGFPAYAESRVAAGMAGALEVQAGVERDQRRLIEDAEAYERAEISIRRDQRREATLAELAEKLEWSTEKTRLLGEIVADARRLHDEELLQYVDPSELTEIDDE